MQIGGLTPYYQDYSQTSGNSAAAASSGNGSAAAAASGNGAAAAASAGNGTAVAVAVAGGGQAKVDQAKLDPEARLEAAGDKFGQALQGLSPKEKADMRKLKEAVNKWAEEQKKQGKNVDKASMFAFVAMLYSYMGLQQNPGNQGLQNLFGAGSNFVDATQNVVQQDQQKQLGQYR